VIRLLAASIDHYERCEAETPGTVLDVGKQLVEVARMLSGVESTRANLRIEAQRKERDIYLGKTDQELLSLILGVPELRRQLLERLAVDAPSVVLAAVSRQKELAGGAAG
jgi:hypothetical protein